LAFVQDATARLGHGADQSSPGEPFEAPAARPADRCSRPAEHVRRRTTCQLTRQPSDWPTRSPKPSSAPPASRPTGTTSRSSACLPPSRHARP